MHESFLIFLFLLFLQKAVRGKQENPKWDSLTVGSYPPECIDELHLILRMGKRPNKPM